jgi:PAS domain S-box-containing protein
MLGHDQIAEELKKTIQILPNMVFKCKRDDTGHIYLTFNEGALAEQFGITTDKLMGRSIKEIVPEQILSTFIPSIHHVFTGESIEFIFEYEGHVFNSLAKPIFDSRLGYENTVVEVVGFITDITNQKKDADRLRENEEQLRTLINSLPDFVFFKDGEGRWLETNEIALSFFQLDHIEYKGKTDAELASFSEYYFDALMGCQESDELAWKAKAPTRVEENIPRPDGSIRSFDVIKVPIFYSSGKRKGLVVIGRDITDRKKAEEALREAETLSVVGQLAAGVAHEIRNPLTTLKGFVQMLSEKSKEDQRYYDIMLSEVDRIDFIISEFLVLAKPQSVSYQKTKLESLLNNTITLFDTQAILSNVQIFIQCEDDLPMIHCEQNQLKQVFINLLKNATEAMPDGGEIQIRVGRFDDGHLSIRFSDQGYGIPEDRLPSLGQPFYTTKEKGTGLGLMVSYKIIKDHKGSIKVDSKVNEGTCFEVILPIAKDELE